jgi:O-antigen/teichoic acid export membrane protein
MGSGDYPTRKDAGFLTGRLFARNAAFNLVGELVAFGIGAICIPYVIRSLGTDAFGILSIAWMLLGYISLFDLGLSRATTKFVAEALSDDGHQMIPSLVWTSITFQLALGLFTGALLALNTHLLAERVLKVPPQLIAEAERGFMFLALAVPIVLVTNAMRGVLEATQQFHLINYIKVPTNILMFSSPLLLIPFGGRLSSIILLMTLLRIFALVAYFKLCYSFLWQAGHDFTFKGHLLARLLRYGGWVTVSSIAGPLLLYSERFVVGALLSVAAVAYYAGPADMVNRALVIPASLGSTLFPAFSSLEAAGARQRLEDIFARALKYLIVVMGPALLLVAVFSRDILYVWLGPVFVRQSTVALQILTLAVFINSLGLYPYSLLQGAGKPNLTASFHLLELPVHLGLVWILVSRMGITGAAVAVAVRTFLDTALLLGACTWVGLASSRVVLQKGVAKSFLTLFVLSVILLSPFHGGYPLLYRVCLACTLMLVFWVVQWTWSFDHRDRQFLSSIVQQIGMSLRGFQGGKPEPYGLVHRAITPDGESE